MHHAAYGGSLECLQWLIGEAECDKAAKTKVGEGTKHVVLTAARVWRCCFVGWQHQYAGCSVECAGGLYDVHVVCRSCAVW